MVLSIRRLKNRAIAKVITLFPTLAGGFIEAYKPWESEDIPWTPVKKRLDESTVAIVTTSGVHQKDQTPFNMHDQNGDPSFREIDGNTPVQDLMITHDYYDHTDAERDLNIVFPIERLREFASEGIISKVADTHYSFMGHIMGPYIYTLMEVNAPEVAARLKKQKVDYVLLTPG
jgi:D-proline reductase (dithiol) PrdB